MSDHIVDANKKVGAQWDKEGSPLNLMAAAADAHEWLMFAQRNIELSAIGEKKLRDCTKELYKFIKQEEA